MKPKIQKFFDSFPIFAMLKIVRKHSGNATEQTVFISILLFSMAIGFVDPFIVQQIMNMAQAGINNGDSIQKVLLLAASLLVIEVIFWMIYYVGRIRELNFAYETSVKYTKDLYGRILDEPLAFHDMHHSGDTISKLTKGGSSLFNFSSFTFVIIRSSTGAVIALAVLTFFNIWYGLYALAILSFALYKSSQFETKLKPLYDRINKFDNTQSEIFFDTISNITTVVTLRLQSELKKTVSQLFKDKFVVSKEKFHVNEIKWSVTSFAGTFLTATLLGHFLYSNASNGVPVLAGSLYLIYSYSDKIKNTFFDFAWIYGEIISDYRNMQNAEELERSLIGNSQTEGFLARSWSKLEISEIQYVHPSGNTFHSPSITINKGSRIALIGITGGGKSTYIKLLRSIISSNATVSVDDGDSLSLSQVSKSITLVPQEPEVFSKTVRENITLGIPYNDDKIFAAARISCFDVVIPNLPDGLESGINEKGVNLSGGQKQRLALTRGVISMYDKEIIMLDEPTASCDPLTERSIYANIFAEFEGKTILSTLHRLHLLHMFTHVMYFENGELVLYGEKKEVCEDGRVKNLLEASV